MCEEHVHEWVPHLSQAMGYFTKRDDGQTNDVVWFSGRVLSCAAQPCQIYLFVPNRAGLSAVECELTDWPAERRAVAA